MEKIGHSIEWYYKNKIKIFISWNNGLKEVNANKRIWKNEKGFYHKSNIGEPLYIETVERVYSNADYIHVTWDYIK